MCTSIGDDTIDIYDTFVIDDDEKNYQVAVLVYTNGAELSRHVSSNTAGWEPATSELTA